jgi:hypothetical protein
VIDRQLRAMMRDARKAGVGDTNVSALTRGVNLTWLSDQTGVMESGCVRTTAASSTRQADALELAKLGASRPTTEEFARRLPNGVVIVRKKSLNYGQNLVEQRGFELDAKDRQKACSSRS